MSRYEYNKKWRQENPEAWQEQKKRYYKKHSKARRKRLIWATDEEKAITASDRPCDVVLSQKLGRTVLAIQIHRSRMKKRKTKTLKPKK